MQGIQGTSGRQSLLGVVVDVVLQAVSKNRLLINRSKRLFFLMTQFASCILTPSLFPKSTT